MTDLGKANGALLVPSIELVGKEEHVCAIERLPALSSGLLVSLSREGWPEGRVGDMHVDIRELATKEWQHWSSTELVGGDMYDDRPTEQEVLAGATKGKPRLITHAQLICDWPGVNPNANPKTKEEGDTRKMLVQNEVRLRLVLDQPIRTRIAITTFTRPGTKLIERYSEVAARV